MNEQDLNFSLLSNFRSSWYLHDVKLTDREVDIIAWLLQGRTQKTIAHFLSVAPRTVETHTRNIMLKLGCSSREGIIDYIERIGQSFRFRQHYQHLIFQREFDKQLENIASKTVEKSYQCHLIYEPHPEQSCIFEIFKEYITKTGIKVHEHKLDQHNNNAFAFKVVGPCIVHLASKDLLISLENISQQIQKPEWIFILWEKGSDLGKALKAKKLTYFNFYHQDHIAFLKIIQSICPGILSDDIVNHFKKKYESLNSEGRFVSTEEPVETRSIPQRTPNSFILSSKIRLFSSVWANILTIIASILTIVFMVVGSFVFRKTDGPLNPHQLNIAQTTHSYKPIRAELAIPHEPTLLKRTDLLNKIHESFKNNQEIEAIALIGIGGAGKTTLARQYAHSQSASVVWEINAETSESLYYSFENLAYTLAQAHEEKSLINNLQEIKDIDEKVKKLLSFIKEKLKNHPNWLLLFDNVEKFSDVRGYFPIEKKVWGKGNIIITTRNHNIANNECIRNIIEVNELNDDQKFQLLSNILNLDNLSQVSKDSNSDTLSFLKSIPPFPLDISVAAYYLKTMNISYQEYLKHLEKNEEEFDTLQTNLLKETGQYTLTRYNIITLTLANIINVHPDFKDLLLFISLIDSQDIPKELLENFKNKVTIDNFVYHLKKYSLATSGIDFSRNLISIHRSTQEICLNYLLRNSNSNKKIDSIATFFEKYVEHVNQNKYLSKMKFIISHLEFFLNRNLNLSEIVYAKLYTQLGGLYLYLGKQKEARIFLEKYIPILIKHYGKFHKETAQAYEYLGNAQRDLGKYQNARDSFQKSFEFYQKISPQATSILALMYLDLASVDRELGDYQQAKELLEKSIILFNKNPDGYADKIAWASTYLGCVFREIGNYEKAKNLLNNSTKFYKDNFTNHSIGYAWSATLLANTYRSLGQYEPAIELLKGSLKLYESHYSEESMGTTWVSTHLSTTYRELGYYKQAKNLIEKNLEFYKKNIPEHDIRIAWNLVHLGKIYADLNNYNKAKELFEKSLVLYRKHYSENNNDIVWVSMLLGNALRCLGEINLAKELLEKSLSIYEKNYGQNHLKTARVLGYLGQLYLAESKLDIAEDFMLRALKIYEKYGHPHQYIILENMADLYFVKYLNVKDNKKEILKNTSLSYFNRSIKTLITYLPNNKYQIFRIEFKIKEKNCKLQVIKFFLKIYQEIYLFLFMESNN